MSGTYPYAADLDEGTALGLALADRLGGIVLPGTPPVTVPAVLSGWSAIPAPPVVVVPPVAGRFEPAAPPTDVTGSRLPAAGAGVVLWKDAEFVARIEVEARAATAEARSLIVRAMRERLQRADGEAFGCLLRVPRYFGGAAQAPAEALAVRYADVEDERRAFLTVAIRMDVLRATGAGDLLPRFRLEVT